MPGKTDIKLDIFVKNYKIADNRLITVMDIKSPDDSNFYLQLRILQNSKKLNFNKLKIELENSIDRTKINNSLCFTDENKLKFLNTLQELGINIEFTEIIYKKIKFKKKIEHLVKFNENLVKLFCLASKNLYYLSYEIPKDITENHAPLCSISIYNDKKILSEKIYLFPTNSLKDIISTLMSIKNNESFNPKILNIPYVRSKVSDQNEMHNKDIQTRINLQTIISEILTHLEKPKCFRKDGSGKVNFFRALSENISNGETLEVISNSLNAHDSWKILAQHRDPWGFLSFFKGKTHSLIAWEELKDTISNFKASSQALSI